LVADGGHDDDRVDDVGGPGGGASDASGAAGALVVGEDVAGLEYPGDLVLGAAAQAIADATGRAVIRARWSVRRQGEGLCRSAASRAS
jgi:hypothetical protein